MMPKQELDSYQEALERINAVIDEHAEKDAKDAVDGDDLPMPETPQRATGPTSGQQENGE
jgi:hypothetical protein